MNACLKKFYKYCSLKLFCTSLHRANRWRRWCKHVAMTQYIKPADMI